MTHKAYEIAVWITHLDPNTTAITEHLRPFFRLLEEAQYWLPQSEPGPRQALANRIGSALVPRDSGKVHVNVSNMTDGDREAFGGDDPSVRK